MDALEKDALGLLSLSERVCVPEISGCLLGGVNGASHAPVYGGGYSDPIDHTVDVFTDLFWGAAEEYQSKIKRRAEIYPCFGDFQRYFQLVFLKG